MCIVSGSDNQRTYVCFDYEINGVPSGSDPTPLISAVLAEHGAAAVELNGLIWAEFSDSAAAVEAAIVSQWRVQREIKDDARKLRVGVHRGSLNQTHLVLACANGNQIVFTQAVDEATGGTLDARPMQRVALWSETEPTQLWLSTDSRPDIDGRPLRVRT
mgnify:FL=1|tara:strand:- start:5410 stop:5889 length:480 start_codon:yes stop_codon:yes gene_type:complete